MLQQVLRRRCVGDELAVINEGCLSESGKMAEAGSRASILRTGVGRQSNSRVSFSRKKGERNSSKREQSLSFSDGETNSSFAQEEVALISHPKKVIHKQF